MTNQLFEAALGFKSPWFVQAVAFDASQRRLTVGIDFAPGSRFAHPNTPGSTPVARLALVLMLAQQMTFAAVARIVGETWHLPTPFNPLKIQKSPFLRPKSARLLEQSSLRKNVENFSYCLRKAVLK